MEATFGATKDETICFHMLLFADGPDDASHLCGGT